MFKTNADTATISIVIISSVLMFRCLLVLPSAQTYGLNSLSPELSLVLCVVVVVTSFGIKSADKNKIKNKWFRFAYILVILVTRILLYNLSMLINNK